MFCENCGHQMDDNAVFCENCGTKRAIPVEEVKQEEVKTAAVTNVANAVSETVAKSGKSFKVPAIIAAVVVLVAAGIFGVTSLLGNAGGSGDDKPLLFEADNNLYFITKGMEEPISIADLGQYESINDHVQKPDGSGVYYTTYDHVLYYADYKELRKNEEYRPEKISGNVELGTLELHDNNLLFRKNGGLYIYDGTDDQKICNDVEEFWYLDGKILVGKYDGCLYTYDLKDLKEVEYTDESAYILYVEDADYFVYYQYGDYNEETGGDIELYAGGIGKEPKLIAEGVNQYCATSDGEVYYSFRAKGEEVSLMDFVEDPYGDESDIEAPVDEDFKIPTPPGGIQGPGVYYIDNEAYDQAWDEYWEAVDRQNVRDELAGMTYDQTSNELYCYKDGKSKLLSDNALAIRSCGAGAMIMLAGDKLEVSPIIHIDDVDYAYEVREMVNNMRGSDSSRTDFNNVYVCEDGSTLCDIKGLEDYYGIDYAYVRDDNYMVMGVYNDYESVDYVGKIDGTVEMEVLIEEGGIAEHAEDCIYIYEGEYSSGTLYQYKDGKRTKIDDDVYIDSLNITDDGQLLYLADFSYNTYMGELCLYDGKEVTVIEDDVKTTLYDMRDGIIYYITFDNSSQSGGELYSCKKGAEESTFIMDDVTRLWH